MASLRNASAGTVPVVITDPSYIKNASDYEENISVDLVGDASHKTPANFVRLSITRTLFDSLLQPKQRFLCPSPEGDEMLLSLGPLRPLSSYTYLGSHHSDSGLTSLVREGVYETAEPMEEMDWVELVAGSLESTREGTVDVEAFPMLQFCATVPEEDSAVAVFGWKSPDATSSSEEGYSSLVLRAWCKVFRAEEEAEESRTRDQ